MPYRHERFANGGIYHIVIRGIDDNLLFKNIDDYYRGIFSIYEFNNANLVSIGKRREEIQKAKEVFMAKIRRETQDQDPFLTSQERVLIGSFNLPDNRERIVKLLAFCFMPNHIHLLVLQSKEGGITQFMRKVGAGYGGYFNRKYDRKGYVFQNRFVAVHIKDDEQLRIVFVYIHTNPTSFTEPKWKEIGIKNPEKVMKFLENYKWSSFLDYTGKKNFSSVTERDFMLKVIGGEHSCKEFVKDWIKHKKEIRKFTELTLE